MYKTLRFPFLLIAVFAFLQGCKTDFEVNAPEEEIRVVYGVLNPDQDTQYVRISKAFLSETDAIVYAGENDLSVKGLNVRLIGPGGKTWTGFEIDTIPKDPGTFTATQTVYAFKTDGADTLIPGQEYTLEMGAPEDPGFVTAKTTIPEKTIIKNPPRPISGAGTSKCLQELAWNNDLVVYFSRLATAKAYEIRIYLDYFENGAPKRITYGPTPYFTDDRGCTQGSGNVCYKITELTLTDYFHNKLNQAASNYYPSDSCDTDPSNLPKSLSFEVTAIDEFLYNYMQVNNPIFTDFTSAKPEYTNLTGNIQGVGVFGSISVVTQYATLNRCSEALIGLNGVTLPPGCP